jgi:formylglycine-generating enzyme required for sulfatase activity
LVKAKGAGADDDCPAVNISWYDAWIFAAWCGCVLPTEAQWEYACRAGLPTPFSFRNHDGRTCTADVCNFYGDYPYPDSQAKELKSKTPDAIRDRQFTIPVNGKDGKPETKIESNRWGFDQMHGNVWEWCDDWCENNVGKNVRGGSWNDRAGLCRASNRSWFEPDIRYRNLGFRLASCLHFPKMGPRTIPDS